MNLCNGRAQVGMTLFYGGVFVLEVSVVAAVCAVVIRAGHALARKQL